MIDSVTQQGTPLSALSLPREIRHFKEDTEFVFTRFTDKGYA